MPTKKKYAKTITNVDKTSLVIEQSNTGTGQFQLDLTTPTRPVTWLGGHLFGSCVKAGSTSAGFLALAIVIVYDGDSVQTLGITNGTAFYKPEKNILWSAIYRFGTVANLEYGYETNEPLKAKRKLQVGDKISFIARANVATFSHFAYAITVFIGS